MGRARGAMAAALLAAAVAGMPCAASAAQPATQPAIQPAARPIAQPASQPRARPAALPAAPRPDLRTDFRMRDGRITESSGLALSIRHPHTVWTVNDSGDSARVFAVDTRSGATVGVHTFDARVRDVEALAITPQGRMLVADIGDNTGTRQVVRVFWFDEPALGTTSGGWASWELSYPDGPHDAEALAVDPTTGRIVVVTKESPGGIYVLPAAPSRQGVNRLRKVGTAVDRATDAVFLPDGSGLAVRTYTSLVVLDPARWQVTSTQLLPLLPQGETVALAPDGARLLVGSEGRDSRVLDVSVASRADESPAPSASASATPSARASGAPSRPASASTTSSPSRAAQPDEASPLVLNRGELLAGLGACAGLVVLSLLVTRLPRGRRR